MKYLIGTLLFVFTLISTDAQKLSYSDGSIDYEGQIVNTINVKLDPKPTTVRESFESWMDDNYDVDLDGKKLLFFDKEVMSARGVVIPQISNKKIDLMVKVDETAENNTTLHVFASLGYDNWITMEEYPFEFLALEEIVYNYVKDYLPEYYLGKVEDSRENLAELREDTEDLRSEMVENQDEIAELRKENEELMMKWKENQRKINQTNRNLSKRNKEYKEINKRIDNK